MYKNRCSAYILVGQCFQLFASCHGLCGLDFIMVHPPRGSCSSVGRPLRECWTAVHTSHGPPQLTHLRPAQMATGSAAHGHKSRGWPASTCNPYTAMSHVTIHYGEIPSSVGCPTGSTITCAQMVTGRFVGSCDQGTYCLTSTWAILPLACGRSALVRPPCQLQAAVSSGVEGIPLVHEM